MEIIKFKESKKGKSISFQVRGFSEWFYIQKSKLDISVLEDYSKHELEITFTYSQNSTNWLKVETIRPTKLNVYNPKKILIRNSSSLKRNKSKKTSFSYKETSENFINPNDWSDFE